ncbi:MAG TPA: metallophosphoesterase, partial [Isosphaeraceae bacterium]
MPIHLLPAPEVRPAALSRRDALRRLALGGAALGLGRAAAARPPSDPRGWYALVSDTHIAADPTARSRGQTMAENLRAVIADILAQDDPPRGVVINGDLALAEGQSGDYRTLLTLIEPLRAARLPIHLALGNHDDRDHVREVLGALVPPETAVVAKHISEVEGPDSRFVILDSLDQVNVTPGTLGAAQRAWLARSLDARPETATILLVHHNLDTTRGTGLSDTAALLEIIRPRRQVKAVIYGHTHVWDVQTDAHGLQRINLPAVGYPFAADQPLGWCRFWPSRDAGDLTLRTIGGDHSRDTPLLT